MICLLSGCQNNGSTITEQPSISSSPVETEENTPTPSPVPTPSPTETVVPQREDADFRNAKWGDDKEAVRNYETQIVLNENNDALIGECWIIGYNATAMYIFDGNEKLVGGSYIFFPNEYASSEKYISAYNELKSALTEEYGTPTEDIIRPLDQDFIDFYGEEMALSFNNIEYEARWETETTTIYLTLAAPNYETTLVILYIDKTLGQDSSSTVDSGL